MLLISFHVDKEMKEGLEGAKGGKEEGGGGSQIEGKAVGGRKGKIDDDSIPVLCKCCSTLQLFHMFLW